MILTAITRATIMKHKSLRSVLLMFMLLWSVSISANTYIVAVGIADYSLYPIKIRSLRLPAADAGAFIDMYKSNTAFDYIILTDKDATRKRILSAMNGVYRLAGPDDQVVFFFSGHGYAGGICAADGNLSYKQVREAMKKSRSRNKMMFLDACRSGGVRVEASNGSAAVKSAKDASVMVFLSSRNNENSIERPSMSNGYFTTYLVKGMKGAADTDNNRIVTAYELFNYVHNMVEEVSGGKQHPVMWGKFNSAMPVIRW